jgi:hypothetical protein
MMHWICFLIGILPMAALAYRYLCALETIANHPGNRGSTAAMRSIAVKALHPFGKPKQVRQRRESPQLPLIEAPDAEQIDILGRLNLAASRKRIEDGTGI